MTLTGLAVLLFVLVQIAIGAWASRRVRGETDYLVAGRRLPVWMAGLSIFATWFAAESVIGASGAIRDEGLSGGRADPMGYALALILMGLLLAARFWKMGAVTLGDVFRMRFGPASERVASVVMIPTSILWCAAQLLAFASILASLTPLQIDGAVVVAVIVAVVYTGLGGLWGDVMTDVIQGGVVLIGVLVMLAIVAAELGGSSAALAAIEPEQLRLVPEGESLWSRLDVWMVPVVGALVTQESVSRILGCRSAKGARNAALMGGGMYLVFGLAPVILGLMGAHIAGVTATGDDFIPALAEHTLPPWARVLFLGAMCSAILSTVDSSLLAVSGLVSHNLTPGRLRADNSPRAERRRLLIARIALVAAGIVAGVIALGADSIMGIVLEADSLGTAGVATVVLFGLFTRLGGPVAAITTLVIGLAAGQAVDLLTEDAPAFIISLAASILAFIAVAAFEPRTAQRKTPDRR